MKEGRERLGRGVNGKERKRVDFSRARQSKKRQ